MGVVYRRMQEAATTTAAAAVAATARAGAHKARAHGIVLAARRATARFCPFSRLFLLMRGLYWTPLGSSLLTNVNAPFSLCVCSGGGAGGGSGGGGNTGSGAAASPAGEGYGGGGHAVPAPVVKTYGS